MPVCWDTTPPKPLANCRWCHQDDRPRPGWGPYAGLIGRWSVSAGRPLGHEGTRASGRPGGGPPAGGRQREVGVLEYSSIDPAAGSANALCIPPNGRHRRGKTYPSSRRPRRTVASSAARKTKCRSPASWHRLRSRRSLTSVCATTASLKAISRAGPRRPRSWPATSSKRTGAAKSFSGQPSSSPTRGPLHRARGLGRRSLHLRQAGRNRPGAGTGRQEYGLLSVWWD